VSSFSKSIGLSGYRVGYVATKNEDLYNTLKIRSLYKYNSISTLPQYIIHQVLCNKHVMDVYKKHTVKHISDNINYLKTNNLLSDIYTLDPIGPFAIVNLSHDELLQNKISSVPLNSFTINKDSKYDKYSRISLAVNHNLFIEYFDKMLKQKNHL
jgi:aspartate/methionine/tyrosine aminotransferase